MCWLKKNRELTIEEIVARNSASMTEQEKAQYWYELNQSIFSLLGKVEVAIVEISPADWIAAAQNQYPTLTDIKIADSKLFTTSLAGLTAILKHDWTNLAPYVAEVGNCNKYGTRLYSHLCDYYKINAIVPVWGDTDRGYHGFNLAVLKDEQETVCRLIEPQSDSIFTQFGPLGRYTPWSLAAELGILKKNRNSPLRG